MGFSRFAIPVFLGITIISGCSQEKTEQETAILDSFEIANGFQIELIAMEPLISDPVAMEIDENGETYVVEMHGYPLDTKGSGVVKKIYDDNGDGVFDRSEVFYDQLMLPTGIMKWKQGVLVSDPPDLLYLEDTTGDGRADKKEVIITGFALSNPQHNFNSPIYGLDNWIYLANEETYQSQGFDDLFGDEGSEIYFPNRPNGPRLPKNANNLNVRIDLMGHRLEMLSGDSQYGHTFDAFGHHFGTRNWSHIYHDVLDANYILRNPNLQLSSSQHYVPEYGIGFEIFPITQNPEYQLLSEVGALTSSCGITWYLGDLFPPPYSDVVLIAEPTHNLVHTDVMYNNGATFGSKAQFTSQEFLASKDGWFRPVNFYVGPDGSLYLLDFHRKIIEHPEWLSEEILNSGELYQGLNKGRIFRITPTGTPTASNNPRLGQASKEELIQYLQHPNIWWRRNAQRLLVDSQDQTAIELIKDFSNSSNEMGVLHSLWTLEGLDHFDKELILEAFKHSKPGIRENAIKIAELHRADFPELESHLVSMTDDPDSKVRFQLLCTLGFYETPDAVNAREYLLFQDIEDPWVQLAGLSARSINELALSKAAVLSLSGNASPSAASLISNLSRSIGKRGSETEVNEIIRMVTMNSTNSNVWWQIAAMNGLAETVKPEIVSNLPGASLDGLSKYFQLNIDPGMRSASLKLLNALGYFDQSGAMVSKARRVVSNDSLDPLYRIDGLNVLAWSDADGNSELFQNFLVEDEQAEIRIALIVALGQTSGVSKCEFLIDQWKSFTPTERDQAIDVFQTSTERQLMLLKAMESNRVNRSALDWSGTVRLLNSQNQEVRQLARKVLEGNESISDSAWLKYQGALALDGDATNGGDVFTRTCSTCHQINGAGGIAYGPDLATVGNRSRSGIMIDILKPNRSISDGYDLWTIQDKSGNYYTGIITNQNINTLTLRNAAGEEELIQQSDIEDKQAAEISAMPEGLHSQILPQEMADLLEYLKQGN